MNVKFFTNHHNVLKNMKELNLINFYYCFHINFSGRTLGKVNLNVVNIGLNTNMSLK